MYWSWAGNSLISGKMLKIFLLISFSLVSSNSYGCLIGKGSLSIDGEIFPLHQKFEPKKKYLFPAGSFLLQIRLVEKGKKLKLSYVIKEKRGTTLMIISRGDEEDMEEGQEREIFAKGLPGKPNSIISFTFEHI